MRKLLAVLALISAACTVTTPPPALPEPGEAAHGLTIEEEALILQLEDRRQYDAGSAGDPDRNAVLGAGCSQRRSHISLR